MKTISLLCVGALCAFLAVFPAGAATMETAESECGDFATTLSDGWYTFTDAVSNRLELGARFIRFTLDDAEKGEPDASGGYFLGSIYKLDEEQSSLPFLFARWNITPYFGSELSWDHYRAETINIWDGNPEHLDPIYKSDGTFDLSGPMLSIYGRYPNETRVTPSAGVGYAYYKIDFEEAAFWGGDVTGGNRNSLHMDDQGALFFFAGLDIRVYEGWTVELYVRKQNIDDLSVTHVITTHDGDFVSEQDASFPMSYTAYGIGAKYCF